MIVVVMGVSGSGKSTLGRALASHLGWAFVEGDDHHPQRNVEMMRAGRPLSDEDRLPWLRRLHDVVARHADRGESVVLACSALKAAYQEILGRGLPDLRFVFLCGETDVIRERMRARERHFMPAGLLDNQLADLEPPDDAVLAPVELSTREQVGLVCQALELPAPGGRAAG